MLRWMSLPLLLVAASGWAQNRPFTLTLLHTNDIHGRVEPANVARQPFGGYARVATLVKRFRATDPNVLLLNAGDTFQGTLYFNVYKGLADAHLMNLTGYQAMALGNHEFDEGPELLAPFARAVRFPLLAANLDFSREPRLRDLIRPSTVLAIAGQRVGVIGLMTEDLPNIASPGPTVTMKPLDASLRTEVDRLTKAGVNKIIVLSHLGYQQDVALAKRFPNVDIIVGGHSHSYLGNLKIEGLPAPMGPYPTQVGDVLVVQAWEWAKLLGRIKLDFDASGKITRFWDAAPIPVDRRVTPDPVVQSAIEAFQKPIEALADEVVGNTTNGLDRDVSQSPEMPIGNVIADAQLAFVRQQGAKIGFMNRGGVRAAIDPGPITYGEIIAVQPFGNTLVVLDLTGAEIKAMLEVGAERGSFVQVSAGFSYTVKASNPVGQRVVAMTFEGRPIESAQTYRVVVNNFMAKGGDGFTSLANASGFRLDTGFLDVDALITYMKANNPAEMALQGRVKLQP